jgi:hypothetical protein
VTKGRASCDDDDYEEDDHTYCVTCGQSDREESMLLCDGCDAGYHMACLTPPLTNVPSGEWFCIDCVGSNPEYAEGKHKWITLFK